MRHRVAGYKLTRTPSHRKSMFRNLAAGVIQHGQITTTLTKAKAVQSFVEKLITLARKGDLHSRRRILAKINDRALATQSKEGDVSYDEQSLVQRLFNDVAPRYKDRTGGYTRIIKLGTHRIGDGADLVVLQLVGDEQGVTRSGRFSRRRQMQDNRTAFAAKLRKGGKTEAAAVAAPAAPEASGEAEA